MNKIPFKVVMICVLIYAVGMFYLGYWVGQLPIASLEQTVRSEHMQREADQRMSATANFLYGQANVAWNIGQAQHNDTMKTDACNIYKRAEEVRRKANLPFVDMLGSMGLMRGACGVQK